MRKKLNSMKKFIALFLTLIYFSTNASFAFSELYYLKNIKTTAVEPIVSDKFTNYGFNVIKQNPYYAVSRDGYDHVVIILQQSGENMFYYYQSENNNKVNKAILKEIKRMNVESEQSFNASILDIYNGLAKDVITTTGSVKQYTFEETDPVYQTQNTNNQTQSNTLKGYVGELAAGTTIGIYLQNAINTSTAQKGDQVIGVLTGNLTYNNNVIAPQGSLVYGTLTKARSATYGSRNGRVVIDFNQIVTPDNKTFDISTEEIDFSVTNEGKIARSAKSAIASAATGALVGMLFALLTDNSIARGAAIGAGMGAGTSVIHSTAERGVDAEIPSFTELEITLSRPLNVSVSF